MYVETQSLIRAATLRIISGFAQPRERGIARYVAQPLRTSVGVRSMSKRKRRPGRPRPRSCDQVSCARVSCGRVNYGQVSYGRVGLKRSDALSAGPRFCNNLLTLLKVVIISETRSNTHPECGYTLREVPERFQKSRGTVYWFCVGVGEGRYAEFCTEVAFHWRPTGLQNNEGLGGFQCSLAA